ncbi:MAG: tricarboxylic transporter [Gammaproteobacteria bacterium]|nr:tricarboxylic transporter [Gammaproteobacteria bacterium]|tara:strand:- start:2056 stop:3084 length:1029 start_codon:yes stop_codon:yes gene_type:complete
MRIVSKGWPLAAVVGMVLLGACEQNGSAESEVFGPSRPECIAPSAPGGGFDLTCKLAQKAFRDLGLLNSPMRVTYQPGGIGAVAMNSVIAQRASDANIIVAFSGGSLLNLAQGKFGRYSEHDVRWVAASGIDYGMLAVRDDSSFHELGDLIESLKANPAGVVFGAGGTVGSQDWMKSALIARVANIDYRGMRYVPFEGGGEAQVALLGGHIQVYSGDISEVVGLLESGRVRILAVMSDARLPGRFAEVPTAKEQGFDLSWPILRGYYTGPDVSEQDYAWWVETFETMMRDERFDRVREEFGMFPYAIAGADLHALIAERMAHYRLLAQEFDLNPQAPGVAAR